MPSGYQKKGKNRYRVLIIFGGRNCSGRGQAAGSPGFAGWADEHNIFLVGPGFTDSDYWYPEKWSGKALLEAIAKVRRKYGLSAKKRLLYYGYSAGGQCVNLFLCWKPEIVKAWGVHACGVWADVNLLDNNRLLTGKISGLVTCGEADEQRMILSRNYIYGARENGMKIIWRSYKDEHELQSDALQLARNFFTGILNNDSKIKYAGDDQAMNYFSAESRRGRNVEKEYRNEFSTLDTARLWSVARTGK